MSVPVFTYHHVLPEAGYISQSFQAFEAQMLYLAQSKVRTLSIKEFAAFKRGKLSLEGPAVLLTFDDGWKDNLRFAYPVLKRYALRATMFVATQWVEAASLGKKNGSRPFFADHHAQMQRLRHCPEEVILNWDDLASMRDVFDIQAHSHSHREGLFWDGLPACDTWEQEFALCRDMLQQRLGLRCQHFCWPRGIFEPAWQRLGQEAGFSFFYTCQRGVNLAKDKERRIFRIAIKEELSWLKRMLYIFSSPRLGAWYSYFKK